MSADAYQDPTGTLHDAGRERDLVRLSLNDAWGSEYHAPKDLYGKARNVAGYGFEIVSHPDVDEPEESQREILQNFWFGSDSVWQVGPDQQERATPSDVLEMSWIDYEGIGWISLEVDVLNSLDTRILDGVVGILDRATHQLTIDVLHVRLQMYAGPARLLETAPRSSSCLSRRVAVC